MATLLIRAQFNGAFAVVNLRHFSEGNLLALCDLVCGPILIRDARVIQQREQRAYVALPQVQISGRWVTVLSLDEPYRSRLKEAILAAYLASLREQGEQP